MAHLIRKTKNLIIRPLNESDYETWFQAWTTMSPQKNKWDRSNKSESDLKRPQFRKILASQRKLRSDDTFFDLAVFETSSKKLVGTVAVMDVLRGVGQTAYLGYSINNQFWGRGYGKEATLACIDIAFRDLKLHRIEAGIEPTNRRSILLARSIGLRKEGLKKRAVYLRNVWVDLAIYSATCEEFGLTWKGSAQARPR
jgi:[ribosomal protein S5]-alanine N-acetyltransferase